MDNTTKYPTDDQQLDSKLDAHTVSNSSKIITYLLYAVIIIGSMYLLYYLYNHWNKTKQMPSESFVKGNTQERDDTIADFNLHETIKDLENAQQNILKNLSEEVNI